MKIKPFKLERYYTLHEHSAKYSLCNSDCEAMTIADLLSLENGAKEAFNNTWLGYTHTQGSPELRRDITTIYSKITAEDVIVCTGAQEPIFLFSHAMLNSDDEVIVQTPCYQSLKSVPESIGCKVLSWHVRYEKNVPCFDIEALKKMITNKTKVIYLNAPHNPTGFLFTKEEQQAIIELARINNIIIFCDEVYRELEHNPSFAIPAFADAYENGVSIGVLSKAYGLPGLRIGWLATKNQSILEKVAILKEYTTICNAGPSEFLAGVALRNRHAILDKNLKIIQDNLPLYDIFFTKYADLFSWYKPNAGPIAFVKMHFDTNDMDFAEQVLKEKSVLILPSGVYDFNGYFRIGFGRQKTPEALEQFESFVLENLMGK
ncbi:aminotransferase class I/II-fold pyridoxal phosphate-dependent enzyme [Zobellia uliginosa]|uniref:aminotransferase class I/II-fold pyridoxal phosphate-dependent enzyme n=1 Tax=Zobellia uliginosa TaxID=143224 RepID=UPI001C064A79|nr:aminotransferase class I/II-fold pyridoxal phosphate-dependent enzyme [Zobellia uliginosa]MBU2945779.1 aminotransferase class I/II-fold pyridoxal phosphate-dependent enzyme [Zobellia uliginosa]